jgi:uncharacterized protein (DUF1501 family)
MSKPSNLDRRLFLRQGVALTSALGVGAPLALQLATLSEAAAQSAPDYKAVVCLFMMGGNDAFNTVLPTDTDSWDAYQHTRGQAGGNIALLPAGTAPDTAAAASSPARYGGVRPITLGNAGGRGFAVHPLMNRTQGLVNSGRMSVLANVGPLIEPLTRVQYEQKARRQPARLFSHNDQQNIWQSFQPEGASRGWGGLMADAFVGNNSNSMFTALSASGNSVWLSGRDVRQYQLGVQGATRIGNVWTNDNLRSALQRVVSAQAHGGHASMRHVMQKESGAIGQRSVVAESTLNGVLPPATDAAFGGDTRLTYTKLDGKAETNSLAQQLQVVARTIAARNGLGMRRQVFFVSLGGFDTHDSQNSRHADLMLRLDHALGYFNDMLQSLGMQDQVLTFTASEFGRSFTSNGDGTDHGWGGHQFVMGGGLTGGQLYGQMPTLVRRNTSNNSFDASTQQIASGVLIPTTSVDQLAYSVGRWMGVSDSHMMSVLPNLGNFNANTRLVFGA